MTRRSLAPMPDDYAVFLEALKGKVRQARLQAQRYVNAELIGRCWRIGKEILTRQEGKEQCDQPLLR